MGCGVVNIKPWEHSVSSIRRNFSEHRCVYFVTGDFHLLTFFYTLGSLPFPFKQPK